MPNLPDKPSLDHLRKQAKDFLRAYRAKSPEAIQRLHYTYPRWDGQALQLKQALQVIAAEYRYPSWNEMKQFIERQQKDIRSPYEQCCDACLDGEVEVLRRLLDEGESSFSTPMNWGHKPLMRYAMEGDDADCVTLLLERGAPTSVWEFDVLELLDSASSEVRVLIEARRDLEEQFVGLIASGHCDQALTLLRGTPQLANAFHDAPYQRGPLMLASMTGHLPLVQTLLDAGARVDSHFDNSQTTAHTYAVVYEHDAIVQLLEDHGAKVDRVTEYHNAAKLGKMEMVKAYLESGVDVNAKDSCQHHVLPGLILSYPKNSELLEYVLSLGADINQSWGWEDYIWFEPNIKRGEIETIRRILEMGIEVNHIDKWGHSAMKYAHKYKQPEIEQLLIEYGAKSMMDSEV